MSDVDLADITGDFLASLRLDEDEMGIERLDLDTATHFLVVAATLIELKAARLLPAEEGDVLADLLAEARDVLYARLLEYRAFREASAGLASLLVDNEDYHGREVALEPQLRGLVPDAQLGIEPEGLAPLAAVALAPRPEPKVSVGHIHATAVTVRDAARRILSGLPPEGATFRTLVRGLGRSERIVAFLAILELYKLGHLELDQVTRFGDVTVRHLEGGTELDTVELDEMEPDPRGEGPARP